MNFMQATAEKDRKTEKSLKTMQGGERNGTDNCGFY